LYTLKRKSVRARAAMPNGAGFAVSLLGTTEDPSDRVESAI
jgi:hypothetical protein